MTPSGRTLRLEVMTGSLAGRRLDFEPGAPVLVGRVGDAALRFDPDGELEVSGRHAELRFAGGEWVVHDLESTNGTWVNGVEVSSPRALAPGDELWLGRGGPRIRVLHAPGPSPAGPGGFDEVAPGTLRGPVAAEAPGGDPGPSPARAPSSRRRGVGAAVWAAAAAAALVLVVVLLVQRSGRQRWIAERDLLTARVDSLLARESSLAAQVEATRRQAADSVAQARAEIERLRDRLQSVSARPGEAEVEELRRELQEAMVLLEQQQLATALDVEGLRRRIEPAVAMIWSERSDGAVATGTAVSVDGDGTLLTSRHVVAPEDRGEGERLAVQFAGSAQVWRARVLETHPRVDLARVQPQGIVGRVPSLQEVNLRADTLAAGSPVAIVGFPLGGRARTAADGSRPRAVVSAGVLVGGDAEELRIRGYGAEGASGSPVVDRDGRLVGIVFGGTDEGGSRLLLAVPIRYVTEFGR